MRSSLRRRVPLLMAASVQLLVPSSRLSVSYACAPFLDHTASVPCLELHEAVQAA